MILIALKYSCYFNVEKQHSNTIVLFNQINITFKWKINVLH